MYTALYYNDQKNVFIYFVQGISVSRVVTTPVSSPTRLLIAGSWFPVSFTVRSQTRAGQIKMSSLAKQLKQLQIPGHISGAAATKFKTKASLLFDAKEAADIDNETIYSLGINGLEELKAIEPSFANFESTLFSESSKSIQRTLQTKEFNEKLDKQISKLLSCLSPYILLKPAQKILEWLIRRFGVQIYNVNQLVCCILPYHETKLFARVIQILSISDPSAKWHWLEPLQKSGSPLPRSAVVQHCISDPAFLSLICEMVPQAIENNCSVSSIRVLFTFYASTLVAVVEQMKRVTEEFITMLLPYLVKGLKSGTTELKAASYMIVGQLCVKCSLEERLLKSVLESVCKVSVILTACTNECNM